MKLFLISLFVGLALLSGCRRAELIEHEEPNMVANDSFFVDSKCYNDASCVPSSIAGFDPALDSIHTPPDSLGGLTPVNPVAVTTRSWFQELPGFQAVFVDRCLTTTYTRYLVVVNETLQMVDSVEGLAAIYAPIDSEPEALSYALAATGFSALYNLESIENIQVYSDPLEETFISKSSEAFIIHLFDTSMCGCGPHIVKSVDITVNTDGSILIGSPVDAYSDPALDAICAD
jgi:hypothetical protein